MPKDNDEGNKRIENIFGQIGLGNLNPERILEIQEEYERVMALADFMRSKKGRRFKDAMREAEATADEAAKKEEKPEDK